MSKRLHFIRRNHINLRDSVNQNANTDAANIGRYVILTSTLLFYLPPRYMDEKTQD